MQVHDNCYRSILWQFYIHAIPAKQRSPSVSHCYCSIYTRLASAIIRAVGNSMGDQLIELPNLGLGPTGSRLPVLGAAFLHNYG